MTRFLLSLAVVALLSLAACTQAEPTPTATAPSVSSPEPTATSPATSVVNLPSIADVVEQVRPAVVTIAVELVSPDFFGRPVRSTAAGSGVIFDERGYTLTNNHVVEGATRIQVTLADRRTLDAELVGRDPGTDLAVIDIQGDGFPTAPLGDSESLRVGDWVIAIGNALNLEGGPTVTLGVVGARGRAIGTQGGNRLYDMIQTDAAINPGNSGGPLLNLAGEVVGINTAIIESAEGIGFSVAMGTARGVAEQLVENGRVIWPYLGISVEQVTPEIALEEGLPLPAGAIIRFLISDGPSDKASLVPDDIIIRFAGETVETVNDLQRLRRTRSVGETVTVTILRDGQERDFQVTLEAQPPSL